MRRCYNACVHTMAVVAVPIREQSSHGEAFNPNCKRICTHICKTKGNVFLGCSNDILGGTVRNILPIQEFPKGALSDNDGHLQRLNGNGPIAQWLERRAHNPQDLGSNPNGATMRIAHAPLKRYTRKRAF